MQLRVLRAQDYRVEDCTVFFLQGFCEHVELWPTFSIGLLESRKFNANKTDLSRICKDGTYAEGILSPDFTRKKTEHTINTKRIKR